MLEKDIERKLGERLRKLGCLYYKFVSPQNTGVPDRLVVCPDGHVIFVELKTEDGRLSELQKHHIAELEKRGAHVDVVYGWVDALLFAESVRTFYCPDAEKGGSE